MDIKNTPHRTLIIMKKIFLLAFIVLLASCQKTDKSTAEDDMIIAQWYIKQGEAASELTYNKYYFNYEEYSPYEIITAQKNEVSTYYHKGKILPTQEEKVQAWTERQKEAISLLDPKNRIIHEKIDINELAPVLRLLKEEKACLDKIEWSNKEADPKEE